MPTESAPATIASRLEIEAELSAAEHQRGEHADIADDRADRIADAGVEPGARQVALAEPVLHRAGRHHADDEHDAAATSGRDRKRDAADPEAEIGGAQRRSEVLRDAPGPEHQRDAGDDDREPRKALDQHDDLFERVAPEADRRHQAAADRRVGAQQLFGALLHDDVDDVERRRDDGDEQGLLDEIGREGDVAGERRAENDDDERQRSARIGASGSRAAAAPPGVDPGAGCAAASRSVRAISIATSAEPTARPATAMLSEPTASAVGSSSRSAARITATASHRLYSSPATRSGTSRSRQLLRRGASNPRPSALLTTITRSPSSRASSVPCRRGSEMSKKSSA